MGESEGIRSAEINVAEGRKQSAILKSAAEKAQLINEAEGQARAVIVAGEARAKSLEAVAEALGGARGGQAASLAVAENYVKAWRACKGEQHPFAAFQCWRCYRHGHP